MATRKCSHGLELGEAEKRYKELEQLASKCSYEEARRCASARLDGSAAAHPSEEAVVDEYMQLHVELFRSMPPVVEPGTASACFAMAGETLRGGQPRPVEARQWRLKGLAIQFYLEHGEAFFDALTTSHSTSIYEDWRRKISIPDEEVKRRIREMCTCSCLGCHVCGAATNARCGKCRKRFYCSRECQKEDWQNNHQHLCQPEQAASEPSAA